jgi:tRNA(Arg) A34 adenosine deaminase TadA
VTAPNPLFMQAAIAAAQASKLAGDYAVGSVIVYENQLIAQAGNRTHLDRDPTQHAEMIAIREAARCRANKDLSGCILYATHEPCPMCMSAIVWSRVSQVVFGATMEDHKTYRDRFGNDQWRWRVIDVPATTIARQSDSAVKLVPGFMREECIALFHS